ncbi:MAG: hypothetical protein Q9228_007939 [Teloschistes exilis]
MVSQAILVSPEVVFGSLLLENGCALVQMPISPYPASVFSTAAVQVVVDREVELGCLRKAKTAVMAAEEAMLEHLEALPILRFWLLTGNGRMVVGWSSILGSLGPIESMGGLGLLVKSAGMDDRVIPDGKHGWDGDKGKEFDRSTAQFRKAQMDMRIIGMEDEMLDVMAPVDWRYDLGE